MDLKINNNGIGFTNPLSLSGDRLLEKWKGKYIKIMTPDLVKVIQNDFTTAMKLPLSSSLFTKIFLSQNVDNDTLEEIVLGIADRTFMDFIFTDPYGLADLFITYVELDLQDADYDGYAITRRGRHLKEEILAHGERGDKIYERLKYYERLIEEIENENERKITLEAFRLIENELMGYMFPF